MAKSSNQKTKLLHLYRILLRQTDEDHPITVAQIIGELEKYGINDVETIQVSVSTLSSNHSFKQQPAPWIITGRAR